MTTAGDIAATAAVHDLERDGAPAFVWRLSDGAIVGANGGALALFGAASLAELSARRFDRAMPAAVRLRSLALVLAPGAVDRQTLLFWLPDGGRSLDCICQKLQWDGGDAFLLRVASAQMPVDPGARPAAPLPPLNGVATGKTFGTSGPAEPTRSATPAAPPPLAPRDAETLAEIARLIRQRRAGGPAAGEAVAVKPDAVPAAAAAVSEITAQQVDFLGRLTHELRTPLNAVIGYGELLQSEQQGPLGSPKYRTYVADLLEAARHCVSLVNDLFDMTRLASGERKPEFREVDINLAVKGSLAILDPIAQKACIELKESLPPGLPAAIVDPRSLRQILLNLVGNAIKFTPKGGTVTIASRYDTGVGLSVVVSDTGTGMAVANLDAARGNRPDPEGALAGVTGLGLPISRALAAACGGSLTVDSQPGRGTSVTLFLPMTRLLVR